MRLAGLLAALLAGCFEPASDPVRPDTPFRDAPDMPEPRAGAAVGALGSRLVVAGGRLSSTGVLTRQVIALDTFTGKWEALPDLPAARADAALAASAGTPYLFGGFEGTPPVARGEAYALDPGAYAWRDLPPLPAGQERGAAAVVVSPPHIYLIGGLSTAGVLSSVLAYNLTAAAWTQLPDLPSPRAHAAAMRLRDGTLIVAGGLADPSGTPLGDVHALPLGAAAWERRRDMPTPRGGCAYGQALGWLVCAGGQAGVLALRVVEAYDPIGDAWTELPELPDGRAGAQGAVIGQQLYIAGGAPAVPAEPTSGVLVLSLIDALSR